jgi:hypothetical protein
MPDPTTQTPNAPPVQAPANPPPGYTHPSMVLPQPDHSKPKVAGPVSFTANLVETQFRNSHYTLIIPEGHEPGHISKPEYWQHHAKRIKLYDTFDCISPSGNWECTVRCIAKGDTWARMRLLNAVEGKEGEHVEPLHAQFDIKHVPNATGNGWRVIHKDSKTVVAQGFSSKDDARRALDKHIETLTR